jgi:hypothetical protein
MKKHRGYQVVFSYMKLRRAAARTTTHQRTKLKIKKYAEHILEEERLAPL